MLGFNENVFMLISVCIMFIKPSSFIYAKKFKTFGGGEKKAKLPSQSSMPSEITGPLKNITE